MIGECPLPSIRLVYYVFYLYLLLAANRSPLRLLFCSKSLEAFEEPLHIQEKSEGGSVN